MNRVWNRRANTSNVCRKYRADFAPEIGRLVGELEERLTKSWLQGALFADPKAEYADVAEYDPVLRSHCRLEE